MTAVLFDDPVYGEVRFTEPLLAELYASEAVQCLRADVVEQAAGLLHDVAHTAFSHVVDFVGRTSSSPSGLVLLGSTVKVQLRPTRDESLILIASDSDRVFARLTCPGCPL